MHQALKKDKRLWIHLHFQWTKLSLLNLSPYYQTKIKDKEKHGNEQCVGVS